MQCDLSLSVAALVNVLDFFHGVETQFLTVAVAVPFHGAAQAVGCMVCHWCVLSVSVVIALSLNFWLLMCTSNETSMMHNLVQQLRQ